MDEMKTIIEQCRKNFGPVPRSLTPRERCDYWSMPPPIWLRKDPGDGIWDIYRAKNILLEQGMVVWGVTVQANELLFMPGKSDCPAMVIYSTDACFDNNVEELHLLADQLFALKGTKPVDVELAHFAAVITNERDRSMCVAISHKLTRGRTVNSTNVMVFRKHLPNGVLSLRYFPLLIHPESTPCTIMLPYQYWPKLLRNLWVGEAPEPSKGEVSSKQ